MAFSLVSAVVALSVNTLLPCLLGHPQFIFVVRSLPASKLSNIWFSLLRCKKIASGLFLPGGAVTDFASLSELFRLPSPGQESS